MHTEVNTARGCDIKVTDEWWVVTRQAEKLVTNYIAYMGALSLSLDHLKFLIAFLSWVLL